MSTEAQAVAHAASLTDKRANGSAATWSIVVAAVLTAFYLVSSIYIAAHRLLYFDEVFSTHIARLPHLGTIWTALAHGVDSQPPLHYVVLRIFDKSLAHTEVAVRLPSALALAAGLLITFDCARRLTNGLYGLIALSVAACSFIPYYGYDARPYAISFMLAALALWVWTCTDPAKKSSAVLFGAVLFLSVSFHYYAVLLLVPFALFEVSRWRPWQLPSARLIAGAAGVVAAMVPLLPLVASFSQRFSASFRVRVRLPELIGIFPELFPEGLFLLALIVVWIVLANRERKGGVLQPMQSAEAVGWLFLCIPLAAFVAARLKAQAFAVRYFIDVVPGVAVALSCYLWRRFRRESVVTIGILLILMGWGLTKQLHVARDLDALRVPGASESFGQRDYLRLEGPLRSEGKRVSAFSNPFIFLTAQFYSKNECVLVLPSDFNEELKTGELAPTRLVVNLSHYHPFDLKVASELGTHRRGNSFDSADTRDFADFEASWAHDVETRYSKPLEVVYLKGAF